MCVFTVCKTNLRVRVVRHSLSARPAVAGTHDGPDVHIFPLDATHAVAVSLCALPSFTKLLTPLVRRRPQYFTL